MKTVCTQSFEATQKLGEELARTINPGQVICLSGDLGAGKTTFVQGLLKELKVEGPYTSPTFLIMKQYKKENTKHQKQSTNKSQKTNFQIQNIYHIDAYRIGEKDILNLGWEEIIQDKNNIIVIEWAERIKEIIPKGAQWIKFSWEGEQKRKIVFK